MDTESEKLCLGELDHLILDVGKKVGIRQCSLLCISQYANGIKRTFASLFTGHAYIYFEHLVYAEQTRRKCAEKMAEELFGRQANRQRIFDSWH